MRRAARVDENLTAIVAAYRKMGCSVHVLNGVVDLIIGFGGLSDLVEIKNPERAWVYTAAQKQFRRFWTGGIRLVQTVDDVAIHVSELRKRHARLCKAS